MKVETRKYEEKQGGRSGKDKIKPFAKLSYLLIYGRVSSLFSF